MRDRGPKILYVVLLLLLFFNDLYFKSNYPGLITGKLSDFTGIACLCIVVISLTKNKKLVIALFSIISLGFIWWKSPYASFFIDEWNKNAQYQISRVVDATDLVALIVVPVFFFHSKYSYISTKNFIRIPIVLSSLLIFISSAGTHGRIKQYEFDYSKDELRKSILNYFDRHKDTKVPDSLAEYTKYYKTGNLDSDSVNFYFYLPYGDRNIIFWSRFSGDVDNWDRKPTQLMFIGVRMGDQYTLQTKDSLSYKDRREFALIFEREVINKLQQGQEYQVGRRR